MAQMLVLAQGNHQVRLYPSPKRGRRRKSSGSPGCMASQNFEQRTHNLVERIKRKFGSPVELSISSYDTAWVAMVPAKGTSSSATDHKSTRPLFPECLDWILQNQHSDGSWGLNPSDPALVKDSLSSTLACILALQTWNVGERLIGKGLDFIGSKSLAIDDRRLSSSNPLGFDLVFPGMVSHASKLGLNLPLNSDLVDDMLHHRDLQLEREKPSSLAYIAEALGESYEWDIDVVMKYQRSNGSFFNSPATTAAASIYLNDDNSLNYLKSVLHIYGTAVPTVYPFNIYTRLSMVDTIEKLGIARFFKPEIESVLHETYSYWQQGNEEIFMDLNCIFLAFRLLRMNGYEIQSNALEEYVEEELFLDKAGLQFTSVDTIIELYKASEITLFKDERILEKINEWTRNFLKNKLRDESTSEERLSEKVTNALENSINTVDRIAKRRNIETYNVDEFSMLKTSFRSSSATDMDMLTVAKYDFNECQSVMRDELEHLGQWIKENKIDTLKWDLHIVKSGYLTFGGDNFTPEGGDARLLWTKNCILGTLVDDMFDIDGSPEEILNIMELVERWDEHLTIGYRSKVMEIVFPVLHQTIDEYAAKASTLQGRCIRAEFIEMWVDLVRSMMRELEWWRSGMTPKLNEHVRNGAITAGTGLFLMSAYLLGLKLSPQVMKCKELDTVYHLVGGLARLVNDSQGYLREEEQRKINSYGILLKMHADSPTAEEDARKELATYVEHNRRELLRLLVQRKDDGLVPREVRQILWNLCKICLYYYTSSDEYRLPTIILDDMKKIFDEPIPISETEK